MKKVFITALCLFALVATSQSLKAQEISITLHPGWTWISYTRADTLTFAEALGYFIPMEGDMINSQEHGSSVYRNGSWRGGFRQFTPGPGYMYYSQRSEDISFVYTHAYQPVVNTLSVSGITTTSATVDGNFVNDGGATMRNCGICWGTNENPTTANNIATIVELTPGEYALELTNLIPGTTYHVRAFATNSVGTTYGDDMTFTTTFILPTVTTDEASWVTTTTAIVGGQYSFVGNCVVTDCGICYRTEEGTETCISIAATNNTFSTTLEGLTPNTTYIVRAYATNGAGTAYGEEKTFTTLEEPSAFPNGAINSLFTVNAEGDLVYFSQGNLQYIGSAATPYWKFADNQWDYFGEDQNGDAHNIDRDLFGWGTSGYDHGAVCYQPWSTDQNDSYYYPYGGSNYNLYDQSGNADWGYNPINNGGNSVNQWRTMSANEWSYIFNSRNTESGIRFAKAIVNGVNGVVLLPDNWRSSNYVLNNTNDSGTNYDNNNISAADWKNILEAQGAVFLPAAGDRWGISVVEAGTGGFYWSSSCNGDSQAVDVSFRSNNMYTTGCYYRHCGRSVRLVRSAGDVYYFIDAASNSAEGGTVTGAGTYDEGSTCILTANANEGYTFVNWTENGEVVSTQATYSFTVTEARNLVANFVSYCGVPTGAVNGRFTINGEGNQVYFSQGNLQYIGSAGNGDETNTGAYWKFADYQWEYFGATTGQISDNKTVDRDLFGWATSGYNHNNADYQPWTVYSYYTHTQHYAYGDQRKNLYDQTGQADWGYNSISNGGNVENSGWRTPTAAEWAYVFNTRANAASKWGQGNVNGVNGMILLPDEWTLPEGLSFTSGDSDWANVYSVAQWTQMEANGAVFLPAAYQRYELTFFTQYSHGVYWTSNYNSYNSYYDALVISFQSNGHNLNGNGNRCNGYSVRLIRNAE